MAAEVNYSVAITLAFLDATTRTIKFNGVEETELNNIKSRVKAINANYPTNMAKTFISSIGAQSNMISKAVITRTQEEVIYNANQS